MAFIFNKTRAVLDIGMVATMIAFIAVLINRPSFAPPLYMTMLMGLMILATIITIKKETWKEQQLDELQLASISFGSRWAITAVGMAAMLFLFVSPLQDMIVAWFNSVEANVEAREGRAMSAPASLFVLGMAASMAIFLTSKSLLAYVWTWTKR